MPLNIYLAGPLFSEAERAWIDRIAERLRAEGFECFVPHEHFDALAELTPAEVYRVDGAGIRAANVLFAWLDGPMVDDGTACEIGIFYGLMRSDPEKKGIVGMTHDIRAMRDSNREGEVKGLNLFVVGCIEAAGTIVTSLDAAQGVLEGWR